jgi:hypothetical protein
MKIRITLTTGSWIDFDAPDDFNFMLWAGSIRESGRWLTPSIYVPHSSILTIFQVSPEGTPVDPRVEGMVKQ